MREHLWLFVSLFGVVMGSVVAVGQLVLRRASSTAEQDPVERTSIGAPALNSSHSVLARALKAVGESVPAGRRDSESLRRRLSMAGFRWLSATTIFAGLKVAAALGLAGFTGWTILFMNLNSQEAILPSFCAAGFGYLLPDRLLSARVRARARRIRSGIPPAIDLLVLTLEAGQSLDQAMHDVARSLARCYPELSEEFIFFHLEVRAGKSRAEALQHLADRSPEPELRKLVSVLLDGDRYGTSLGPALRTHSRYLRTRLRQQAQESARKLTVKLTLPTFFLIFPAVLVVTLGPAYLQLKHNLAYLLSAW